MSLLEELHVVRHVLPLPRTMLVLEFEDHSVRVANLAPVAAEGGALGRLAEADYFEAVRVDQEAGTVVWPDGVDIDPDVLYHLSRPVAAETLRRLILQALSA